MTGTDLATVTQTGNGLARALPGIMPDVTSEALDRLARWVDAAQHAHKLVAPLVGTPWVPAAYQPKVDPRASQEEKAVAFEVAVASATAAVLYGSSLGIDPLMALQQVYVVSGRPALYAKMMVALVQSHGHEVWTEDQSDSRAIVCGRRKGSAHTERISITMDMARKAGWTRNQKYTETPQDMLWARAASRVCDRIGSDVLKGIPSVEEAQDDEAIRTTAAVGTRTVTPRRRPAAAVEAPVDEPPLDDETPAPAPRTSASDRSRPDARTGNAADDSNVAAQGQETRLISQAQQRKLHALLKDNDLADSAAGLSYISKLLDREVESTKELTVEEASLVIDSLAQPPADEEPALDLEV